MLSTAWHSTFVSLKGSKEYLAIDKTQKLVCKKIKSIRPTVESHDELSKASFEEQEKEFSLLNKSPRIGCFLATGGSYSFYAVIALRDLYTIKNKINENSLLIPGETGIQKIYKNLPTYRPDEIKLHENYVAVGVKKIVDDSISFMNDMQITDERMVLIYNVADPVSDTLPYTIIRQKDLVPTSAKPIGKQYFFFSSHENSEYDKRINLRVSNGDAHLSNFSIGPFTFEMGDYSHISQSSDSLLLHNFFSGQNDLKVNLEGIAYSDYDIPAGRTPRFGPDYMFSDEQVEKNEKKRKDAEE